MTSDACRARRPSPALAAGLAGWLLLVVAASGPHLVHHLLDPHGRTQCRVLAAADHAPAITGEPVLVPRAVPAPERPAAAGCPSARLASDRPPTGRSPPASRLASA